VTVGGLDHVAYAYLQSRDEEQLGLARLLIRGRKESVAPIVGALLRIIGHAAGAQMELTNLARHRSAEARRFADEYFCGIVVDPTVRRALRLLHYIGPPAGEAMLALLAAGDRDVTRMASFLFASSDLGEEGETWARGVQQRIVEFMGLPIKDDVVGLLLAVCLAKWGQRFAIVRLEAIARRRDLALAEVFKQSRVEGVLSLLEGRERDARRAAPTTLTLEDVQVRRRPAPARLSLWALEAALRRIGSPEHPTPCEAITGVLIPSALSLPIDLDALEVMDAVRKGFVEFLLFEQAALYEYHRIEEEWEDFDSSPPTLPDRYRSNQLVSRYLDEAAARYEDDPSGRAAAALVSERERRRDPGSPYVYGVEYSAALYSVHAAAVDALYPRMLDDAPGPIIGRLRALLSGRDGRHPDVASSSPRTTVERGSDVPQGGPESRRAVSRSLMDMLEHAVSLVEPIGAFETDASQKVWAGVSAHPKLRNWACVWAAVHLRLGVQALTMHRRGAGVDMLDRAHTSFRSAMDFPGERPDPGWEQLAGQMLAESMLERDVELLHPPSMVAETIAATYLRVLRASEVEFRRTVGRDDKVKLQERGRLAATRAIEAGTFLAELPGSNASTWARRVFAIADLCKARVLREEMSLAASRQPPAGVPSDSIEKEDRLLEAMRRATGKGRVETQLALESVWADIESWNAAAADYVAFRRDEGVSDPDLGWSRSAETFLQLGPSALVVQFHRVPDAMLIAAMRQGLPKPQVHIVPLSAEEMNRCIEGYNFDMHGVGWSPPAGRRWQDALGDALLGPLADALMDVQTVYLLPHGVLHRMPMHAFTYNGAPLILSKKVLYAPSLALLDATLRRSSRGSSSAVFACPRLHDGPELRDSIRGEAADVRSLLGEVTTTPEPMDNACRSDLMRLAPTARHLHFSGHGSYSEREPSLSSIELADGPFTARDWLGLTLDAELVTLSACLTGIQEVAGNDDGSGLVPSILLAGASSLVITLAAVRSEPTRRWMQKFYTALSKGDDKGSAFQKATWGLMGTGRMKPLSDWAPYILLGSCG
jgi:hypothetical protein